MNLLNKIQKELKAPKGQYNSFGKYYYRNCEDILEAVKPLLGEGTLILEDEVVNIGNHNYVKATATLIEDNDVNSPKWSATAYAREAVDQKGMNDSQITGSTSSYARKYALNGLFCIDDTKDSDATNTHDKTSPKAQNATSKASKPQSSTLVSSYLDLAKNALANAKTDEEVSEVKKKVEESPNLTEQEKSFMYDEIVLKIEGIPFK